MEEELVWRGGHVLDGKINNPPFLTPLVFLSYLIFSFVYGEKVDFKCI